MSLVRLVFNLVIILVIAGLIYSVYYLFISRPPNEGLSILKSEYNGFLKVVGLRKEVKEKVIDQPEEVADVVETSEEELTFLVNYAREHNIAVPEEVMSLIRNGDDFVAFSLMKEYMKNMLVSWKDLTVIQVVYQEDTEVLTNEAKQKVYNSLNKLASNVRSGSDVDTQINILKSSVDQSLVSVQTIEKYDCSSDIFDDVPEVKSEIDSLDQSKKVSDLVHRNGYSYTVIVVTDQNESSYCSLDEFIDSYNK